MKFLYDLIVWITLHYSEMPTDFKSRFPKADCVSVRQMVFNVLNTPKDYE